MSESDSKCEPSNENIKKEEKESKKRKEEDKKEEHHSKRKRRFDKVLHLKRKYEKGKHPIKLVDAEFGNALLIGEPGSGKSYLSKWLTWWMYAFYDFVLVLSPTAGLNGNYDYVHPNLVHKEYYDGFFDDILKFMAEQSEIAEEEKRDPPSMLLDLDDIIGLIPFNSPAWKQFIIKYRHYKITLKILAQYLNTEVPTLTRNCITDYFVFPHQLSEQNMRGLWKTMGTEGWDDWEDFMNEAMRKLKPHEFLYFQRRDKDLKRKERYQIMKAPPKEKMPKFYIEPEEDSSSEESSESDSGHEFPHLHSDVDLPDEVKDEIHITNNGSS